MNLAIFFLGVGKLVFAVGVAAVGVLLAARVLKRFLGLQPDTELKERNVAAGIVKGSTLLALALLVRTSLAATFDAVDLTLQTPGVGAAGLGKLAAFALAHLGLTLLVGTALLTIALLLFDRITPGVDELAEVRAGNVSAGLVLGAVVIVVALLAAPGLESALYGLIPFPELPERFPS